MMIDPYSYIEEKKNWNLDKLYKEKDYLERFMEETDYDNFQNKCDDYSKSDM